MSRLTGLERSKLINDLKESVNLINNFLKILSSKDKLNEVIIEELNQIKEKIRSSRKTEISDNEEIIDDESLIKSEDVVVTLTHTGYIKWVPLNSYSAQKRGGKRQSWNDNQTRRFCQRGFCSKYTCSTTFFHQEE